MLQGPANLPVRGCSGGVEASDLQLVAIDQDEAERWLECSPSANVIVPRPAGLIVYVPRRNRICQLRRRWR